MPSQVLLWPSIRRFGPGKAPALPSYIRSDLLAMLRKAVELPVRLFESGPSKQVVRRVTIAAVYASYEDVNCFSGFYLAQNGTHAAPVRK